MKNTVLSLSLALLFAQPSFATITTDEPAACPSLAAIKSVGIASVHHDTTWGWFAIAQNDYDTNEQWSFGIMLGSDAKDEDEALELAGEQLVSLSQVQGPFPLDKVRWGCYYTNANSTQAFAFTPAEMDILSLMTKVK